MSDLLQSFSSGIKNVTTSSAMDKYVENSYTLTPSKNSQDFTISGPSGKRCKIIITCKNAQLLITTIKNSINNFQENYNKSINDLIKTIQTDSTNLKINNLTNYLEKNLKNYQSKYNEAKNTADKIRKMDTPTNIDAQVLVKDMEGRQNGKITSLNVGKKTVTVEYSYTKDHKKYNEKIRDVEIKNLCIEGENCETIISNEDLTKEGESTEAKKPQTGGGFLYKNNINDEKNFKFICE